MIKKHKISNPIHPSIKNGAPKYTTPTETDDVELPGLIVFQGSRGSGKTYACVQLCLHFEERNYIQRTFLICPTTDDTDDGIFTN